jgi:hypothetical protein
MKMGNKSRKLDVGSDSVVIGNDVTGNVGDGSVVIGATDTRGNVILNTPMAVGRGAVAGPNSIAIGAGAGAGMSGGSKGILASAMEKLRNVKAIAWLFGIVAKAVAWFRGSGLS